jgi:hypothetical protein
MYATNPSLLYACEIIIGIDVIAVLLLGGGAGATAPERAGRSPAQRKPREGRDLSARRLGKRTPVEKPPSPIPHGMTGKAMPVPPPPPPPSINE